MGFEWKRRDWTIINVFVFFLFYLSVMVGTKPTQQCRHLPVNIIMLLQLFYSKFPAIYVGQVSAFFFCFFFNLNRKLILYNLFKSTYFMNKYIRIKFFQILFRPRYITEIQPRTERIWQGYRRVDDWKCSHESRCTWSGISVRSTNQFVSF